VNQTRRGRRVWQPACARIGRRGSGEGREDLRSRFGLV